MGSLQVMFDGQMDPQGYQQQIFMNTATTNPATDLGLLLLNGNYPGQTNFVLSPGQPSPALALTGGAANLPLMAYYMQTNQAVAPTAGNFFVSTTLNIVY